MSQKFRKIVLGSVVTVFVIAIGVWWYSGFSLDFMKFFAAEPGVIEAGLVSCSPVTQTVRVGAPATLTATGGSGVFTWTAPEGSPAMAIGQEFQVTYAATGTKKVLVESTGNVVVCTVVVTQ